MKHNVITPPIVDTDIWVYLILSGYYKRIIEYYGYLQFSDVVEREIMNWQKNKQEFSEIAHKFSELKAKGNVKIIQFDSFDSLDQASINHTLSEFGLKEVGILEKNKGEFTSLLYALHKDIHRFKTNDRKFKVEVEDFIGEDFTFVNWTNILDNYSKSFNEKIQSKKLVDSKQLKMKQQNETYKKEKQDPRWDKLKELMG
ncbi:hypothetical protein [Staphylococcus hominis]|uniref:hypothetical protein n=1 Tax=Staphylococcus hominis TaxID=1290 RepID=UPI0034CFD823